MALPGSYPLNSCRVCYFRLGIELLGVLTLTECGALQTERADTVNSTIVTSMVESHTSSVLRKPLVSVADFHFDTNSEQISETKDIDVVRKLKAVTKRRIIFANLILCISFIAKPSFEGPSPIFFVWSGIPESF